ncbi:hypothetical protein HAZT_HAZT000937 [Hyalella azteca]|uniref:Tetratricopeptide repeat protein 21A/21B fifth ARM repeats domain-containing protein n=1 Tax=Hyalella azteca TaxID=294128 RepID=A0A6A0H244_HYAAZ|nr:hypothetical protein HAZT_HAZT000937 [Hyalella azteca]
MCCKMAEQHANQRNYDEAIQLYKDALDITPDDPVTRLALAKLYLHINNMEMCQKTCQELLRVDEDNDGATVMMADLSYRRNQYDNAMFHFQKLLDRRPTHYSALSRLIEVLRRTGRLEEAEPYMTQAQQATHRPTPGMFFCQGLLDWYTGNPNSALKQFNQARKDPEWGQRAIYNMIEICLNPDNDTLGGETFQSMDEELHRDSSSKDTQDMAIRTANKLLKGRTFLRRLKPFQIF